MPTSRSAPLRLFFLVGVLYASNQFQPAFCQPCLCETTDERSTRDMGVETIHQAIDTCGLGVLPDCRWQEYVGPWAILELLQQGRLYADARFKLYLPEGAIVLPRLPRDSTVTVDWRSVDTSFRNLREGLAAIERALGPYSLEKISPQDSAGPFSQDFICRFVQMARVDLAESLFNALPSTTARYLDIGPWPIGSTGGSSGGASIRVLATGPRSFRVFCRTERLPARLTVVDPLGRQHFSALITRPVSSLDLPSSLTGALFIQIGRFVTLITLP